VTGKVIMNSTVNTGQRCGHKGMKLYPMKSGRESIIVSKMCKSTGKTSGTTMSKTFIKVVGYKCNTKGGLIPVYVKRKK